MARHIPDALLDALPKDAMNGAHCRLAPGSAPARAPHCRLPMNTSENQRSARSQRPKRQLHSGTALRNGTHATDSIAMGMPADSLANGLPARTIQQNGGDRTVAVEERDRPRRFGALVLRRIAVAMRPAAPLLGLSLIHI